MSRIVLHTVGAAAAAAAIVFSLLAWQLSRGTVSLSFLTPYVADALRDSDSPYIVEFSDTILTWAGWDRTLDIRLLDVRAVGPDGALAATAPEISLGLSVPALLRGLVAPTSLEIIEPVLRIVRNEDGGVEFGLGERASGRDPVELLLADLLAPPDPTRAMGYLTQVRIIGADLTIDDRRLGVSWRAPRATVGFSRDGNGIGVVANLDLELGGRVTPIEVRTRYVAGRDGLTLHLAFADLRPDALAQHLPALAPLAVVDFPVAGSIDFELDGELAISSVAFDLETGAGRVAAADWLGHDLDIVSARVRGDVTGDLKRFRIDDAMIDLGGPTVALQGMVELSQSAPFVVAGVTVKDLAVDDLGRYWPPELKPELRDWLTGNLGDGIVRQAQASIHVRPGDLEAERFPDEALRLTIDFEDVTVAYYRPLPEVRGVNGSAIISGNRAEILITDGRLKGLVARSAKLLFDDIDSDPRAEIDVVVTGPIGDALEVLAHPQLDLVGKLGLDPARVGGVAETRLRFVLPHLRDLTPGDVVVTASAELRDAEAAGIFGGYRMNGGTLSLDVDRAGMSVVGDVALNGVPVAITWRENFLPDEPRRSYYTVRQRLGDSQRLGLGLPGGDYIAGPTDVDIGVVEFRDGRREWLVTADLRDAALRIPEIRWAKPAGVAGSFRLTATGEPGKPLAVDAVELIAGDLHASGRAEYDSEAGVLRRLDLDRLAFGGTDVTAAMERDAAGAWRVSLRGASLDLRPFLEDGDETGGGDPPFSLDARLDRVVVSDGQTLAGVSAAFDRRDDRWERLIVDGALGDGKRLSIRLNRDGDGRALWLGSDDAGRLLRGFGIFDTMAGGKLVVTGRLDDDGVLDGELTIADFRLTKAPALASVLSIASLTGIFDLLSGEGLPFTRLVVPFTKRGGVIAFSKARAYGPAIGLTARGKIDWDKDTANVRGTLAPANTLNMILGAIPLLGDLLVGVDGGGLFAATYEISGPVTNPEITVNPLAVLAPGVLRELFTFGDDDAATVEPFTPPD